MAIVIKILLVDIFGRVLSTNSSEYDQGVSINTENDENLQCSSRTVNKVLIRHFDKRTRWNKAKAKMNVSFKRIPTALRNVFCCKIPRRLFVLYRHSADWCKENPPLLWRCDVFTFLMSKNKGDFTSVFTSTNVSRAERFYRAVFSASFS